jgi:hypothetical protein
MVYWSLLHLPHVPAKTEAEIELLEQEPYELAKVVDFARSSEPFALFLRSFSAEVDGFDDYDGRMQHLASLETANRIQSGGLVGVPNLPELFDVSGQWTFQADLLGALAKRFHTVLLGDMHLLDREARAFKVYDEATRIMLVTEAWWPAFELLAQHARVIVVLVDVPSSSLVSEVRHLRSRNLKFLCVQKQGVREEADESTIAYQDYQSFDLAMFERMLDDMLRG